MLHAVYLYSYCHCYNDSMHTNSTLVASVLTLPVILFCLNKLAKCFVQVSAVVVYVSGIGVYTSCRGGGQGSKNKELHA